MIDTKENLVTFKIEESDRDWAEDEQKRLKRSTGEKPSQARLFGLLKRAYVENTERAVPLPPEAEPPALTEDQRDLLAILAEDPEKALLFKSVQTLVQHALEEYRSKWKPKKKAAAKGAHHERHATGT